LPAVPAGGVPASVAVPLPLSLKVTLVGNAPLSARAAAGKPLEVTRNVPARVVVKAVLSALVIVAASSMVRRKF
jgi:hypothetical protein